MKIRCGAGIELVIVKINLHGTHSSVSGLSGIALSGTSCAGMFLLLFPKKMSFYTV